MGVMTASQGGAEQTGGDGYARDPDLLAGCTIKIDDYREAVAAACADAMA